MHEEFPKGFRDRGYVSNSIGAASFNGRIEVNSKWRQFFPKKSKRIKVELEIA